MTLNEAPRAAVADVVVGDDAYLWLEAVDGEGVLDWAQRHSEPTLARLSGERFEQMRAEALEVFDADTRIPGVSRQGEYLYNFWRDADHPRGSGGAPPWRSIARTPRSGTLSSMSM